MEDTLAKHVEAHIGRLGRGLAKRRVECGLTRTDVARRAGLAVETVRKIETGTHGFGVDALLRLASVLRVSVILRDRGRPRS